MNGGRVNLLFKKLGIKNKVPYNDDYILISNKNFLEVRQSHSYKLFTKIRIK